MCFIWDCTVGMWKCNDDKCISNTLVCDYTSDCKDGSDERPDYCVTWECPEGMWKCSDNVMCITQGRLCNDRYDCLDWSDEDAALCSTCPGKFNCLEEGECISFNKVCNGMPDCHDRNDELDCEAWNCTSDQWKTWQYVFLLNDIVTLWLTVHLAVMKPTLIALVMLGIWKIVNLKVYLSACIRNG